MVLANDKMSFLTFWLTPNSLSFQLTPPDSSKHFMEEQAPERNCHLFPYYTAPYAYLYNYLSLCFTKGVAAHHEC